MKFFASFRFTYLDLVLINCIGACKFYKTYTMPLYQGGKVKYWSTYNPKSNLFEWLDNQLNCKDSQFESLINLGNLRPFTNFVGLISKSYSNNTTIHFYFFPSRSSWARIVFTTLSRLLESISFIAGRQAVIDSPECPSALMWEKDQSFKNGSRISWALLPFFIASCKRMTEGFKLKIVLLR